MNILLVSQPAHDGVLRHVSELVNYLHSAGDRVHLAYSDWRATDQLSILLDRIRSAGGGAINLRVRNAPQLQDLQAVIQLFSFIRITRPDVIHAHSAKAGGLVRGLGLLGLQTPVLYTPHSFYRMHDRENRRARLVHFLERLLGRIGTTIVGSISESKFAQEIIGVPLSRQQVITNAVDFERYYPAGDAETRLAVRAQLGLPSAARLLGSVGRMTLQKDPLTMYSAFADAARDLPDVCLVHVGQGELEPDVNALIAARGIATRCYRIPYMADTAPLFRALDGFLLTSLYEGMSYAVLEALATNLPLVLTRAPGNNDFAGFGFSHVDWGEPGNVRSIAAAIRDWRGRMDRGELPNHRDIACRHFAPEACFLRVREAYGLHLRAGLAHEIAQNGSARVRNSSVATSSCRRERPVL